MASINIEGLDDLVKKLDKLAVKGNLDDIAMKAVDAAAPVVESSMRSAIGSMEYGPYSTGSIASSVQATSAAVNGYGVFAVARPTGRDSKGERNGAKAAYLQYGTPNMPARPWRQKAVNSAMGPAIKTMEEVVKAEMELD